MPEKDIELYQPLRCVKIEVCIVWEDNKFQQNYMQCLRGRKTPYEGLKNVQVKFEQN